MYISVFVFFITLFNLLNVRFKIENLVVEIVSLSDIESSPVYKKTGRKIANTFRCV